MWPSQRGRLLATLDPCLGGRLTVRLLVTPLRTQSCRYAAVAAKRSQQANRTEIHELALARAVVVDAASRLAL